MKLPLSNAEIAAELPHVPASMTVFTVENTSIEARKEAIEILGETMNLGSLFSVNAQESIHFVSEKGEVQYYRPSGAIWAYDASAEKAYPDERRPWKVREIRDQENEPALVLEESQKEGLAKQAEDLFRKMGILGKEAYLDEVELDQIVRLDEKGNEKELFAGEANVKFLYKLEGVKVGGPGAKSYAFFNPGENEGRLTGLFHSWRIIKDARTVRMGSLEKMLDKAIVRDGEILLYHRKGYETKLTRIDLVYFALPPFKYQDYVFPALRVVGACVPREEKRREEGFEFARYYQAVTPKEYAKADFYAEYLISRL
jgi:hypothetical protein